MGWVDDKNNKYDILTKTDLKKIDTFEYGYYYFRFGEMTEFDRTSILMKVQSYYDKKVFWPSEFVNYMLNRGIRFKIYYRPVISEGILNNFLHLKLILKLNLRILMYLFKNKRK
ncbi:MAG: hypothetical protein A4E56_00163 [Pelotomaculum sp. PtaU1.Bin065]|nr:MAG: hypothetical protein A4E56_00163 [Pelotomaculum sp. PtaU1.Bin065]